MATYVLTESDRLLVTHALRERSRHLRELVEPLITPSLPERVCEQYVRQADQAERLAMLVERSHRMDIWPKNHESRRDAGPGWQSQLRGSTLRPAKSPRL